MSLFGAGAFSPQSIMNAASIINGQGLPAQQQRGQGDPNVGDPHRSLLQSLFHMLHHQDMTPMSVNLQSQPLQQPGLMSYFGGM